MNQKLTIDNKPWYRHPWPWILMAGPFVVIIAGAVTTYLAVLSNDGLVVDDYYKQGLEVNQITARDQNAVRLGMQADVMQNAEQSTIRILLQGRVVEWPELIRLRATHPTRPGVDQTLVLLRESGGAYTGKLSSPLAGRWHIALEDEKRDWRLTGEWVIEKQAALHLPVVAAK